VPRAENAPRFVLELEHREPAHTHRSAGPIQQEGSLVRRTLYAKTKAIVVVEREHERAQSIRDGSVFAREILDGNQRERSHAPLVLRDHSLRQLLANSDREERQREKGR
jgi:hypothetical protein